MGHKACAWVLQSRIAGARKIVRQRFKAKGLVLPPPFASLLAVIAFATHQLDDPIEPIHSRRYDVTHVDQYVGEESVAAFGTQQNGGVPKHVHRFRVTGVRHELALSHEPNRLVQRFNGGFVAEYQQPRPF